MPRRSLAIIEEVLRSEGTQMHRGALRALASSASAESLARLADIATSDTDADRRQRAEDEVLMLEGAALNTVAEALRQSFGLRDGGRNAYGILGRLANQRKQCRLQKPSWAVRLWLASSLWSYFYVVRSWTFRLRSVREGLIGGLLGCVLLALLYALFYGVRPHERAPYVWSFLLLILASSFAGVLATQRTVPISYQWDRSAAFVVEVAGAMVCCFAGLIASLWLVVLVAGLSGGFRGAWESIHTWGALARLLWVSILAGVVRASTIGAYGLFNTQRRNRYSQIACGVMSTWLAIIGFAYLLWKTMPPDSVDYAVTGGTFRHFVLWMSSFNPDNRFWNSGGWFLLPVGSGFAAAFAAVDAETGRVQSTREHSMNYFWLVVVLLCGVLLVPIVGIGWEERLSKLNVAAGRVVFSGDGRLIATFSSDEEGEVPPKTPTTGVITRIWDPRGRRIVAELRHKVTRERWRGNTTATQVALSPNGRLVAVRDANEISVWEVSAARRIGSIQLSDVRSDDDIGVVFPPNSEQLLVVMGDPPQVQVWDIATQSLHSRLTAEDRSISSILGLALSSDGRVLAVSDYSEIRVWDLVRRTSRVISLSFGTFSEFLALSTDGRLLATGNPSYREGTVKLWDTETLEEIYSQQVKRGGPVAIAPNGKVWVVVSEGKVRVRDVATGRDISILYTRTSDISSVAFSPDGRMLAIADSMDRVVKLWDERDLRLFD